MNKRAMVLLLGLVGLGLGADPEFPAVVKDASGTEVRLAARPHAIVSLTLTSDELLLDLVDPGRLKALETLATDPGISNVVDAARRIPQVTADLEKVVGLGPDLVVVADWKDKGFVQSLRDAGVTVYVFHSPTDFPGLKTAIQALATVVGEVPRGRALIERIDRRLAALDAQVAPIPLDRRPSVLLYSFDGSTYGAGTSFDALVSRAGLVNAATQAGMTGWPKVSKEQVVALDPDLIVLPSWNYDGHQDPQKFLAAFRSDPAFSALTAVKRGRVVILPDRHLQATSQSMVDGVEDLIRAAFP